MFLAQTFKHMIRMPPGRLPVGDIQRMDGDIQLGGDPGAELEHAGGIIYPILPGNA